MWLTRDRTVQLRSTCPRLSLENHKMKWQEEHHQVRNHMTSRYYDDQSVDVALTTSSHPRCVPNTCTTSTQPCFHTLHITIIYTVYTRIMCMLNNCLSECQRTYALHTVFNTLIPRSWSVVIDSSVAVVQLVTHDCTRGVSDPLYHSRHYSKHRQYECDCGIKIIIAYWHI